MSARLYPGSTRVPRVGEGVPPSRTSLRAQQRDRSSIFAHAAGSSFRRDAETNTRDACAPRILLLAALLFLVAFSPARATEPDTFSPVVSYQYLETLAEPGTPIFSPVVSYQYFDWPGDENLTFQSSPSVSYYFSGGVVAVLSGSVRTVTGTPIGGATVTLKRYGTVFWTGTSDAGGVFTAPQLQAANYLMTVGKAGYQTLSKTIAGYHGGNGTLDVTLAPAPAPLTTQLVIRTPDAGAMAGVDAPDPGDAAAPTLKVFNGTTFVAYDPANPRAGVTLYPNRMTVVMSHGMLSSPNEWAKALAELVADNHLGSVPNIVVWDWHRPASRIWPVPIDAACDQGEFLGEALHAALGSGYSQHVHFIGHSLGTIVNRIACDYVHGKLPESADRVSPNVVNPWSLAATTPHITLLDEAEITSVFGQNVSTATELGWKVAGLKGAVTAGVPAAIANWKGPIPKGVTWVDNYISMVGVQRDEAVNVALLKPAFTFASPIAAHSYAHQWYRWSVTPGALAPPAAPPAIGYRLSREYVAAFPPSGTGRTPGSLWYEDLETADALDLFHQPNPEDFEANAIILSAYAVQARALVVSRLGELHEVGKANVVQAGEAALDGLTNAATQYVYQPLDATGRAVLQGYEAGIELLGEAGGSVIYHTGNVVSEIGEKAGNFWDATKDFAANLSDTIDPDYAVTGPLLAPVFRIRLKTEPAPPSPFAADLAANRTNQPAYAWLTVSVPQNAGFLAFDFTVTGDPKDDRIVCAINEQNVFSLAGKFAPAGVPSSTDLIDVSAYAGQTVELFFGLAGGTSTDCEVAIDGIRFVTMPTPKVGITASGPNVAVKWPAAANGWVLEATDSLTTPNWLPVPMTGVAVDQGVATVEQPVSGSRKFYRLRRNP